MTSPKHCKSMQKWIFTKHFNYSNLENARRRPFSSYVKSQDCMLNHCLPMLAILTIILYNIATNLNAFIFKSTNFHAKVYSILKIYIKFGTFRKKSWASDLKYFRNYSLRKTWILECIGGLRSEHPSAVNVLTCREHCTSMQKRIFTQPFVKSNLDHAGRRHFYSYLKSQDCMLSHCLQMLGILTIIPYNIATNSNAFALKTTNFPEKFHSIFRIYIKFATF